MIKSIFDIENRLDIQKEFRKLVQHLHEGKVDNYNSSNSFMGIIDRHIFREWKYRDTIIDVEEYLTHIGITREVLCLGNIKEENFLYYLQFILNMRYTMIKQNKNYIIPENGNIVLLNIPLILEKMNYTYQNFEDKVIIVKRNADVDSIVDKVPLSLAKRLLEYNDFRNENDIKEKREVLKAIDLHIENSKKEISGLDNKLYNAIGTVVNEMGVNHAINKKFQNLTEPELIKWYDKCFLMMIHSIRALEINKIKREREQLISNKF